MPSNPFRPTINKDQEIVVRLNSSEQKAILKDVSTDVILKDLNTCIDKMGGHCALRAIKRLPSGDFAVLTINNEEAEKLQSNTQWAGALESNARMVTRTYGIMINGVRVANFDMTNKDRAIEHIKASNTEIEGLQGMDIKWMGWRNIPKAGQELASLVIEFFTPEHTNAVLDYNILIGREVYAGVVFNRVCKSMQCFRCYSYGNITVQCTNKEVCRHCSGEHSSKDYPGSLPSRCTLCKGNHKAWERVCPLKKQEIDRIAQALLLTPHCYLTKAAIMRTSGTTSDKDVFYEADMDITPFLPPQQEKPGKDKNVNRPARFLVAGNLPIPRRSSQKRMRSRFRSPTKAIRNGWTSPKKSLTSRGNVTETPASTSSTQTKRTPLGPRDPNAVSTRSMGPLDSSPLAQ